VDDPTKFFGQQNKEEQLREDPVIYVQSFNREGSSMPKNGKKNLRHEI
jgi:hypothetical protein